MARFGIRSQRAPILAASLVVASVVSAQGPASTAASAFPIAVDRAPTLASLRRAFPRRQVWRVTLYAENAPDYPIAGFCVGRRPRCGLEVASTASGIPHGITLRSPEFVGPRGLRVGDRYRDVQTELGPSCFVSLGVETGISCEVPDEPTVRVMFDAPGIDDVLGRTSETPTDAELDAARIAEIFWGVPGS